MNGMEKMTKKEMEMVTGGKCNSDYGYFFCCPANADDLDRKIKQADTFSFAMKFVDTKIAAD